MYHSIASSTTAQFKDRGSRFLAFAHHVVSADEAKAIVEQYRNKYHDARHVCFAYLVNQPVRTERSSDDGEPSGTAGKPILNQIVRRGLSDVVVVVVRYFGGVLLGTPGLVNAYRTATDEALAQAQIISYEPFTGFTLTYPYTLMQTLINKVQQCGGRVEQTGYGAEVITARVAVPESAADNFRQWLAGQYEINQGEN